MPRLLTTILLFLSLTCGAQFRGLVINEFSQGDLGSREYIELLVVGHRTCSDSTADIRGWIVDDQNGWYGATNISDGHYRFKDVPQWAAVPYGSLIVLYNAASGQKNLSITLPDDSTDANKDYVYILPINTKTLLEEHDREPDNLSPNPAYVYPPASATAGYNGTSNLWTQHIGLNNTGGDAISVVSRTKRDSAFFSIGYGYAIAAGFRSPKVSIADVAGGTSASLTDSVYTAPTKWYVANVPFNETPGLPNGGVNSIWIAAMRLSPAALHTYTTACSNGPYNFYGQTFTATGAYTVLHNTAYGCVDTNDLYVVIRGSDSRDTTACDSLVYKGRKYTANATVVDVIKSVLVDCDSLVRTLRIVIKKSSSSYTRACVGPGQAYNFNGQSLTTGGLYSATLLNAQGCDSLARLYLTQTRLDSGTVAGCESVNYNGQTYTSSTVRFDTVKSLVTGCDSLIRKTTVVVNRPALTFDALCAAEGTTHVYNGTPLSTTGLYTFVLKTTADCDSLVRLYALFSKVATKTVSGCDSVFYQNRWHFTSTVLRDTVRSLVMNCDSIINLVQIRVHQSRTTQLSACVTAGGSYSFFGQTLTASGNYVHALQTTAGCDSVLRLKLTVAALQVQTHRGCDSVQHNGQTYFASTALADTLRSQAGCDSLIRIDSIVVHHSPQTRRSLCLAPAQTFNFNGQILTASGTYQTRYTAAPCDSLVTLQLVVATEQTLLLRGCRSVAYNGVVYTSSTALTDTVRSVTTGCDSVYRRVQIIVETPAQTFTKACVAQGAAYSFNGQWLSATGHYSAVYTTAAGCDSTVNLYLVVSSRQSQTVSGCGQVVYGGVVYNASALISDTVRSVVSGCDSLIKQVNIVVYKKPLLAVSKDTTICLGGTATLVATTNGTATWAGFGADTVFVSPQATTQYTALAVDSNGCQNSAAVTVSVEDFRLRLQTNNTSPLSGTNVAVWSSANLAYTVVGWEPAGLVLNQSATQQTVYLDAAVLVGVLAQTVHGCRDTAWLQLTPVPLDDVYIPSGFTPNGDGRNDEVRVVGNGIKELDFKIFNRWGQLLFSTADRGRGWDGKAGGVIQSAGAYVYVARVKKTNGQTIEKKGTVLLIR